MCMKCDALIKAIDRYIEKADESLADDLDAEGFAESRKTLKTAQEIEEAVAAALLEETDLFVEYASKAIDLEEFAAKIWPGVKLTDALAEKLETVFLEMFDDFMPGVVEVYLQRTDKQLKLESVSKQTTGWIKQWSAELGELMKLDSHNEIERILATGLEKGDDIATFTRNILDSGIRDEYYRARRVSITEVLRAHSVAQQEAFMQSPAVEEKMWRHTGKYRNKPRQNHVDMDGQVVPKGEPFTMRGADGSTYYPMYPRDSRLPPGESINCHCIEEPVVSERVLGLPLAERQRLQQQAIDSMDDEWEKELDAANRAKAGIE